MSFPFLSLPADLRLEIYHLCLGGNTIHVDWPIVRRICVCIVRESDEEIYAKCQAREEPLLMIDEADGMNRHGDCDETWDSGSALNLNLLLACRQIYDEAWRITWKANVFTFLGRESMHKYFDESLCTKQVNSIQQIHLFYSYHWSVGRPRSPSPELPIPHSHLMGLQKLTIYLEGIAKDPATDEAMAHHNPNSKQEDDFLADLPAFGTCPKLKEVKALFVGLPYLRSQLNGSDSTPKWVVTRSEQLRKWGERTEGKIWEVARRTREQLESEAER